MQRTTSSESGEAGKGGHHTDLEDGEGAPQLVNGLGQGGSDDDGGLLPLLGVLQSRIERLEQDVTDWQSRYAAQEARIADLNDELAVVFKTRSWRITAPLRWAQEQLGRSNSVFKLRVLIFARRFLPRPIKALIIDVLGWTPPPQPTRLFGATLPTANRDATQALWPADEPLVSVIIPCYNYGEYLHDAIASVLAQELHDTEIIVVDDGSTDSNTRAVISALGTPRTRVIVQANAGLSRARNAGIKAARGKYICCLDADD